MTRTEELEKQKHKRRWARTVKLQQWKTELKALAQMLDEADRENGWQVSYGYVDKTDPDPKMTAFAIGGAEFARFVRGRGRHYRGDLRDRPQWFTNRQDARDAAVQRRIERDRFQ
jgi:hypothetical protein